MALGFAGQVERFLAYTEPVAAAILLMRLFQTHLASRYRAFTLYLTCIVAEILVLMSVQQRDTTFYFYVYVAVESVLSLTQILVIAELFSLVTATYPGIARSGRRILWAALAIAVAVSVLVLNFGVEHQRASGYFRLLGEYLVIARLIAFTLLLFLALTLVVLFWFPIPLSRNVTMYVIGYSVYFTCRALTRLAGTLLGEGTVVVLSAISLSIALCCVVFWIAVLSKEGEYVSITVGHRWEPGEGEALVRQLESINKALLRSARK